MKETFNERIKSLREDKGLSIQALARELKVSSSSVFRWENSPSDIKSSQLILLAKYFDVSIDYLLGLEN